MTRFLATALLVAAIGPFTKAQAAGEDLGPPSTDLNQPANPALDNQSSWSQIKDEISQFKKPNIKWGLLQLHPYVGVGGNYDSNIYLAPTSHVPGQNANGGQAAPVRGSWITDTNFGLKTFLPLSPLHSVMLDYDFVWQDYVKEPAVNNTINQTLNAGYSYKGPQGLSGFVRDDYVNTSDQAFTELTSRQQRWENALTAQGEYSPENGHIFAAVDAYDTMDKYVATSLDIRKSLDRYTEGVGLKAGWQLAPAVGQTQATRFYAAYHRQIIHYTVGQSNPKDNKADLLDFGVEGRIAPKLTGQIQTGVQFRKYDEQVYPGVATRLTEWMVATNVTYFPLERTSVNLLLYRSPQESTFAPNQYYVANNVGLSVKHRFPRSKLTGTVNAGMEIDQYPEATPSDPAKPGYIGGPSGNRRDDVYQIGPGLDYDIQEWLRVGASYLYRTRFSVFSQQFSYADQVTSVRLNILF